MKLARRIALITGEQQGIGAAIAVALAEEGADVTITWADDEPAAEGVAGRIRQVGRRVHLVRADVSRLADADTANVLGAADISVNNAGAPSMLAEQAVGGSLIPVPGGVLISTADRHIIGAIGVSGDKFPTADLADESPIATPQSACALASHATQC